MTEQDVDMVKVTMNGLTAVLLGFGFIAAAGGAVKGEFPMLGLAYMAAGLAVNVAKISFVYNQAKKNSALKQRQNAR